MKTFSSKQLRRFAFAKFYKILKSTYCISFLKVHCSNQLLMQHFSLVLGVEGHSCPASGTYLKLQVTWTNSFLCIYKSIKELFKNIITIEKNA